jgi:hypothetical protein
LAQTLHCHHPTGIEAHSLGGGFHGRPPDKNSFAEARQHNDAKNAERIGQTRAGYPVPTAISHASVNVLFRPQAFWLNVGEHWRSLGLHITQGLAAGPAGTNNADQFGGPVIDGMNDGYQMLAEFCRLKQGGLGSLRSWLDRNWKVDATGSPSHSS